MQAVEESVRQFLIDGAWLEAGGELLDTDSLLDKGVVDSVAMMELIGFIEDSYSIRVPDDDLMPENFDSLTSIATYVRKKQGAR